MRDVAGKWVLFSDLCLDSVASLLKPGGVHVIGARPGVGKTTFASNLVIHLSNKGHEPLVYRVPKSTKSPRIQPIKKFLQETSAAFSALIIDEIQLMQYSHTNEEGTAIELQGFFASLREIALERTVPVIVLANWPRLCEYRDDHRPRISDLTVTCVAPEDFDAIFLLYRNSYYRWEYALEPMERCIMDDVEISIIKRSL